jgi:hypothetical protein
MKEFKPLPQEQKELIRLCQDKETFFRMCKIPHPFGMVHQFNKRPLSMADYAWASTMFSKHSIEALPIVKAALEKK